MESNTTILFQSDIVSTFGESPEPSVVTSITSGQSAISLQNLPIRIINRRMATQTLRETKSFNNLMCKLRKFMSYDAAAARRRRLRAKRARNRRRNIRKKNARRYRYR